VTRPTGPVRRSVPSTTGARPRRGGEAGPAAGLGDADLDQAGVPRGGHLDRACLVISSRIAWRRLRRSELVSPAYTVGRCMAGTSTTPRTVRAPGSPGTSGARPRARPGRRWSTRCAGSWAPACTGRSGHGRIMHRAAVRAAELRRNVTYGIGTRRSRRRSLGESLRAVLRYGAGDPSLAGQLATRGSRGY
jgi:hypothetical protein